MDKAGLSSLVLLGTDLQKSDLHRFDLQPFPSLLSQLRCPGPASHTVIGCWDGGRKSSISLNADIYPSASIPLAGCRDRGLASALARSPHPWPGWGQADGTEGRDGAL